METIAAKKTSGGEQNTEIVEDQNPEENLSAQITEKTDEPQNLSTATPSKKSKDDQAEKSIRTEKSNDDISDEEMSNEGTLDSEESTEKSSISTEGQKPRSLQETKRSESKLTEVKIYSKNVGDRKKRFPSLASNNNHIGHDSEVDQSRRVSTTNSGRRVSVQDSSVGTISTASTSHSIENYNVFNEHEPLPILLDAIRRLPKFRMSSAIKEYMKKIDQFNDEDRFEGKINPRKRSITEQCAENKALIRRMKFQNNPTISEYSSAGYPKYPIGFPNPSGYTKRGTRICQPCVNCVEVNCAQRLKENKRYVGIGTLAKVRRLPKIICDCKRKSDVTIEQNIDNSFATPKKCGCPKKHVFGIIKESQDPKDPNREKCTPWEFFDGCNC